VGALSSGPGEPAAGFRGWISVPAAPAKPGKQLRPAILSALVLTALTDGAFPLLLFAIASPLFPRQANGSLVTRGGVIVGSTLIGQEFTCAEYFHSRPSAAGSGYDGASSGGANLGPNNPKLMSGAPGFAGIRRLAEEFRERSGLSPGASVPIDAVTRSASGLDPHISPDNAALQIPRVARARGLSEEAVRRLVTAHTEGPQLGFLGSARVSVLELNLALDQLANSRTPRTSP